MVKPNPISETPVRVHARSVRSMLRRVRSHENCDWVTARSRVGAPGVGDAPAGYGNGWLVPMDHLLFDTSGGHPHVRVQSDQSLLKTARRRIRPLLVNLAQRSYAVPTGAAGATGWASA